MARSSVRALEAIRARVGDRLERNLSLGQLQQLGRAAAAYRRDDPDPARLTAGDLIRVASELNLFDHRGEAWKSREP